MPSGTTTAHTRATSATSPAPRIQRSKMSDVIILMAASQPSNSTVGAEADVPLIDCSAAIHWTGPMLARREGGDGSRRFGPGRTVQIRVDPAFHLARELRDRPDQGIVVDAHHDLAEDGQRRAPAGLRAAQRAVVVEADPDRNRNALGTVGGPDEESVPKLARGPRLAHHRDRERAFAESVGGAAGKPDHAAQPLLDQRQALRRKEAGGSA